MALLVLSILWLACVAFLIARALVQYGAYEKVEASAEPLNAVSVIVPARNEAPRIERCLRSLLAQHDPGRKMTLIVVDDQSTDDTAAIVRRLSVEDDRLHLLSLDSLPPGWKGKPHACWAGAQTACRAAAPPAWLCFIDADTRSAPALIGSALALARSRQLDMLSLEPFQELKSFWERLIIPAGFFLLAFSQDLRKVNDPHDSHACANGQFLLLRREAYDAVNGHMAVRDQISEDSALARRIKQSGRRLAVIGAESLITTRMYTGFRSLWQGISRSLVDMVGGAGWAIVFGVIGFIIAIAAVGLPLAGWLCCGSSIGLISAVIATIASAALLGVHLGAAVHFRIPWGYGLLFPLAYLLGLPLAINSIMIHKRHRIAWKDRIYGDAAAEPAADRSNEPPHARMAAASAREI